MTQTGNVPARESANERETISIRRLLTFAVASAASATAAVEVYAGALRAAGVPLRAGFLGATHAQPITAGSFALGVAVCTFWGTVLAYAVGRFCMRPRQRYATITSALALASLVVPAAAGATQMSTKIALAGAHLLVAAIVIPVLVRALPRR